MMAARIGLGIIVASCLYALNFYQDNYTAGGLYEQGATLQKKNNCPDAVVKYDEALRYDPNLVEAYFARAICHRKLNHVDLALADYDQAIRLKPDFVEAYYNRGLLYLSKDDLDRALSDWNRAIGLQPQEPDAHMRRAEALRAKGEFESALEDYETVLRLKPDDVAAFFGRAAARREKGDVEAALADAELGIQRWPGLAGGYLERGVIELFHRGKPEAAAADLAKAVEIGFSYRESRLLLDKGAEALGVPVNDYTHRLAPNTPFNPGAYYLLVQLHLARARAAQDDGPELMENAQKLAKAIGGWPPRPLDKQLLQWPGPILALHLGMAAPDDVRAAAEMPSEEAARRERACVASFYLAEYDLEKGKEDEARRGMQAAAEGCPFSVPERGFAKAELQRLGM